MVPIRMERLVLLSLTAFLAVTAIAGGLALLLGWLVPPTELLKGSPFGSYLVPGLALLVLVGGSALIATVGLWREHILALPAAGLAGVMIIGFEGVEILTIGTPDTLAWRLQLFYLTLGLLIVLLAARSWIAKARGRGASPHDTDPAALVK